MKEGYKKTKLGWIPEEWQTIHLQKVAKCFVGIASSATHAYRDEGIMLIRNQNIKEGKLDLSEVLYVSKEYEVQHKSKRLKGGDILTVRTGYPGVSAVVPPELENAQSFTTLIIRIINTKLTNNFLCYYINSDLGRNFFNNNQAGGGQKNVGTKTLEKMLIPIPPLPEQKKIAQILTTLDSKINHIEAQITQTQTLKKGLMQQLLTKGIGHTEFKDSPLGEIPKSWEVVKIGDFLIEHKGGAALKPSDFVSENGFNVIPKKAVSIGGKLLIDEEKPKFCKLNFAKKNQRSIVDSSYLITTLRDLVPSGPNIGYIVKFSTKDKYILSQGVYGLKFNKDINEDFLIHFSNTATFRRVMQTIMVGSTQVHIRNSDYFKVEIPYPPLPEQKKIAQILSTVDSKIDLLENKRSEYQQLKKGMMQVLLTGEVRVKV